MSSRQPARACRSLGGGDDGRGDDAAWRSPWHCLARGMRSADAARPRRRVPAPRCVSWRQRPARARRTPQPHPRWQQLPAARRCPQAAPSSPARREASRPVSDGGARAAALPSHGSRGCSPVRDGHAAARGREQALRRCEARGVQQRLLRHECTTQWGVPAVSQRSWQRGGASSHGCDAARERAWNGARAGPHATHTQPLGRSRTSRSHIVVFRLLHVHSVAARRAGGAPAAAAVQHRRRAPSTS